MFFFLPFLIGMGWYDIVVFDLHFSTMIHADYLFHIPCSHLYISLLKVLFKSLGHFDSDYLLLFFLLLNFSSFYIIRILIPYKIMICKQIWDLQIYFFIVWVAFSLCRIPWHTKVFNFHDILFVCVFLLSVSLMSYPKKNHY